MAHEHNNHRKETRIGPVTGLKAEFDKIQVDVQRLKSDYLRSLAEFDNFRRRKDKEFAELQEHAGERFLQEMIPLLDNFQRALQAAEAEGGRGTGAREHGTGNGDQGRLQITDYRLQNGQDSPPSASSAVRRDEGIRKGLRLIYAQFKETLGKLGLEDYSCLGEQFDPKRCEAVGSIESAGQPEHTIVAETARGYVYRGRVLRPAMVMVTKGSPAPEVKSQKSEVKSQVSEAADGETPGAES